MNNPVEMTDAELAEEILMLRVLQSSLERCIADDAGFAQPNVLKLQGETDAALTAAQHEQHRRGEGRVQLWKIG